MEQRYYSNGKLLLTGEYVVLDGANVLALPTKAGQDLVVSRATGKKMHWLSRDADGSVWFREQIDFSDIIQPPGEDRQDSIRNTLLGILHQAYLMNPAFLDGSDGYSVSTNLSFPRNWGLGTSSTLINNIAQWAGIDAFQLLWKSFGGSGYDIACAQTDTPLRYQLVNGEPKIERVAFRPQFNGALYFVYLNRKQSSKAAIASYYQNRSQHIERVCAQIDKITDAVLGATDLGTFAYQLEKHESILSEILEMQTVKERLFADFDGVVKSLGGWGGDFVLAVSPSDPSDYFRDRGFEIVIPYAHMIK